MKLLVGCLFLFATGIEIGATRVHNVADAGVSADPSRVPSNYSFLQKHVAFFDRNKDGIIYQNETYEGLRALGMGLLGAMYATLQIHQALSPKTRLGKPPSILRPIEIANIALAKRKGDIGVYDDQGNFVESKFKEIFRKYARTNPNAMTGFEIDEMAIAIRDPNDPKDPNDPLGFSDPERAEWNALYNIGKDKDDLVQKETIRSVYDGSLFYTVEKKRKSKK